MRAAWKNIPRCRTIRSAPKNSQPEPAACQAAIFTYSKSPGLLSMPTRGGAIQLANLPGSAMAALYPNVFVAVIQSFQKVSFLKALAPTKSEPPFVVARLVVLAAIVGLVIAAIRRFHRHMREDWRAGEPDLTLRMIGTRVADSTHSRA
jgi:hypothetical protein